MRLKLKKYILRGEVAMTKQVSDILKNYQSNKPQLIRRLARILNHGKLGGTGRLLILPVDQGFEHGPASSFAANPPAYDPLYHPSLAVEAGCSAYAAPFGFLEACSKDFAKKIPLILKANNSDSLYKDSVSPIPSVTSGASEALKLGCSAIGFTIYPGSKACKQMYEEARYLSKEAREAGLPFVIWSYPRGGSLSKKGETAIDVVAYASHIAAQLGAHIIKVKPPTAHVEKNQELYQNIQIDSLSERVKHVIQSTFAGRRIVIFSGGASKSKQDVLEEIRQLSRGGSFGSIVGRNVFQRPKEQALSLLEEIIQIYKQ